MVRIFLLNGTVASSIMFFLLHLADLAEGEKEKSSDQFDWGYHLQSGLCCSCVVFFLLHLADLAEFEKEEEF